MENPNQQNQPTDPNWWQAFFEGPFGRLQIGGAYEQKAVEEVDQITQWLNLPSTAKILDAPSGDGRIARELARRGFNVTGVDFNPRVLDAGREFARAAQVDVHFATADIRELPFDAEFDAVISWFTSYGYFDDAGNLQYLAGLARALRPGGRLVIDLHVAEGIYTFLHPWGWYELQTGEGSIRVLEHRWLDLEAGRLVADWTFLFKDREHHQQSSIRIPSYRDLVKDLRQVGFTSFEAYERPSGKPFKLGSPRLCLVATK